MAGGLRRGGLHLREAHRDDLVVVEESAPASSGTHGSQRLRVTVYRVNPGRNGEGGSVPLSTGAIQVSICRRIHTSYYQCVAWTMDW